MKLLRDRRRTQIIPSQQLLSEPPLSIKDKKKKNSKAYRSQSLDTFYSLITITVQVKHGCPYFTDENRGSERLPHVARVTKHVVSLLFASQHTVPHG